MYRWARIAGEWSPVAPVRSRQPKLAIIGDAPFFAEVADRTPFSPNGKAGKELNRALKVAGIPRSDCDIDNVIACRPPRDEYSLIQLRLSKDRRNGVAGENERHPAEHCAPRLWDGIKRTTNVITMSGVALSSMLNRKVALDPRRGGIMQVLPTGLPFRTTWINPHVPHALRVLPTFHPFRVSKSRRHRYTLDADFGRAKRYFFGKLRWADAPITVVTQPEQIIAFLAKPSPYWTYDTETTRDGAHRSILKSVQIARGTPAAIPGEPDDVEAIVIPFVNVETGEKWFDPGIFWVVWEIIRNAFVDGREWFGWNSGFFDRLIVERHFGVTPAPHTDGIMVHHRAWSELPHGLDYAASTCSDSPSWKVDHTDAKGAESESMEDWCFYGGMDAVVTHRIRPPIEAECEAKKQNAPCPARPSITLRQLDDHVQHACVSMSRVGLPIDQDMRVVMEAKLSKLRERRRKDAMRVAEAAGYRGKLTSSGRGAAKVHWHDAFNPGSVDQVKRLLFDILNLSPIGETDTGEPSTDAKTLRAYLMDPSIEMRVKNIIRPLRAFRETDKQLNTFVRPLALRRNGGVVDDDGRLRVTMSAHTPVTGRIATSDPMNVQNWPKFLRALVKAAQGHIMVGADQDALEGRIASAHWMMEKYRLAFNTKGVDVHQITMHLAYNDLIWTLQGAPPPWAQYRKEWTNPDGSTGSIEGTKFDELRTLCKRYFYGKIYGAGDPTVYELLREAEDDNGNFLYADLTLAKVEALSRDFLEALPELERGWDSELTAYRTQGFTEERITGRRRYFLDGEGDGNEVRNFFDQGAASGLMNLSMMDFVSQYPAFFGGPGTGLIQQGHDSLLAEVPIERGPEVMDAMRECMSHEYRHIYDVPFYGKPRQGETWKMVA